MQILLAVTLIVLFIALIVLVANHAGDIKPPHEEAGRYGEHVITKRIQTVLKDDDLLFTNINIDYEGKATELDNLIVNKYGVFIIEAKNFSGTLYGEEDDYEWEKIHFSAAGEPYRKTVKNPIKQVKREVYILANYLRYYGVSAWVDGYAMIYGADSPVDSDYMLYTPADIDRAIHTPKKQRLNAKTVESIKNLLS